MPNTISTRCPKWCKLDQGWLKCNIDAAIFQDDQSAGFGCIIRDDTGSMIGAKNGKILGCVDPLLTKAMSCREALS